MHYWQTFQGGGVGIGPLPFAGGLAEQPACLMDAFEIVGAAMAALKPKRGES